jgi:hypothetical protein
MSTDVLEYEDESIVEIKIDFSPGDTVPAGALVVRDADDQVRHRIALTPDNIGTWIDLTEHVRTAGTASCPCAPGRPANRPRTSSAAGRGTRTPVPRPGARPDLTPELAEVARLASPSRHLDLARSRWM